MELKIVEERANPLLKRTEYRFEIVHAEAPTPTIDQVRGELSKQLKVPKDRLVVERMHARYGAPHTRGEALAYKDAPTVLAITREHILIRNRLKEKAAPAAPGAETPAPAAPEAPAKPAEEPAAKPAKAEKAEKAEKPEKAAGEAPAKAEKPAKAPAEKKKE